MMDVIAWLVLFACSAGSLALIFFGLDFLWYEARHGDQNAQIILVGLSIATAVGGLLWSTKYLFGGGA